MSESIYGAMFGVAIYPPTAVNPCAICLAILANEIQEALLGMGERVIASGPTDWNAIARTGRVHLCDRCRDAVKRSIGA